MLLEKALEFPPGPLSWDAHPWYPDTMQRKPENHVEKPCKHAAPTAKLVVRGTSDDSRPQSSSYTNQACPNCKYINKVTVAVLSH